jgi:hypothetical protein
LEFVIPLVFHDSVAEFVQAFETREGLGGGAFVFVHGFFDRLDFDFESGDGLAAFGGGVSDPCEDAEADGGEHRVEEVEFHFVPFVWIIEIAQQGRGFGIMTND